MVSSLASSSEREQGPHLHRQQALQALAVEVALHADDEAHAALRHLAGVEVAGVLVSLVLVLLIIPLDWTSGAWGLFKHVPKWAHLPDSLILEPQPRANMAPAGAKKGTYVNRRASAGFINL